LSTDPKVVALPGRQNAPVPMNVNAEQALLGGLLLNNRSYSEVSAFLRPDHFIEVLHGRIYDAAARLIERDQTASPLSLMPFFEREEALTAVGGAGYLGRLAGAAIHTADMATIGWQIVDLWTRRQIMDFGAGLVSAASSLSVEESAADILRQAEGELYAIVRPGQEVAGEPVTLRAAASNAIANLEERYRNDAPRGLRTGLADLDATLGAMKGGDLVVLAGRPSMGKTSLALGVSLHNAARFLREYRAAVEHDPDTRAKLVAFFSLEMNAEALAEIALGQLAGVSTHKIEIGRGTHADITALVDAEKRLPELPLKIDDRAQATISVMRSTLRRLQMHYDIGLVVIDHLHIMGSDSRRRDGNRTVEIGEMSAGSKALAKQFGAPVLLLSQLSRANETRDDKRPTLSDLRFSGEIEQDADVVMFVHRDEYYLRRDEPRPDAKQLERERWDKLMLEAAGKAQIIIAKQRRGPRDTVTVGFDAPLQRFHDLRR
jgi:replicative DNA helicase